jgi:hypothetical protein
VTHGSLEECIEDLVVELRGVAWDWGYWISSFLMFVFGYDWRQVYVAILGRITVECLRKRWVVSGGKKRSFQERGKRIIRGWFIYPSTQGKSRENAIWFPYLR